LRRGHNPDIDLAEPSVVAVMGTRLPHTPFLRPGEIMPASRRDFLQTLGGLGLGAATAAFGAVATVDRIAEAARALGDKRPEEAARDEAFWTVVRDSYEGVRSSINLATVARGRAPRVVTDAVIDDYLRINQSREGGNNYIGRKEEVRRRVAAHVGCAPDEIALTRNTTDGVTTVVSGLPMRAGDEILTTNQEHHPYFGLLHQRAARDGVVVRAIDIPSPARRPDEIATAIEQAISPRTRLILVRRIAEAAHRKGAQLLVDGALAFGHIVVDLGSLGCDYYAASFHKWAGGPTATGFFYARPEHVKALPPLYGFARVDNGFGPAFDDPTMNKFQSFGTHAGFLTHAVGQVLDFREAIGGERIEARHHYLKRYWADQVKDEPALKLYASLEPELSCSLLAFEVRGKTHAEVTRPLFEKKIRLSGAYINGRFGDRESWREPILANPALFTTTEDLDQFVQALRHLLRS
jgi:selenocysteine lyase/cysteine desulfurase